MKTSFTKYEAPEHMNCLDRKVRKQSCSDRELEVLFIRTSHIIENAIKKELRRKGISPKIGAMLVEIYRLNNPSPMELSRISDRTPQTITAITDRMEKKGLVKRVVNESKKNTYKICLTRRGLATYQEVMKIDVFRRIIQTLSEEKRIQLQESLEELAVKSKRLT